MRLVHYLSKDNNRAIKFIEMSLRPDFESAIHDLRNKHKIGNDIVLADSEEAESKKMHLLEMVDSDIALDVEKLLLQLKIDPSWKDIVYQYVIDDSGYSYNDKNSYITRNSNGLRMSVDVDNPDDIILYVGPDTTYEDYRNGWSEITKKRKQTPVRKRERQNFLRDLYIYTLAKEGKPISEISLFLKVKFGKNGDLDYGNIKKIFSTFCDSLQIPSENRPKLKSE